jgi:hypothetical protein
MKGRPLRAQLHHIKSKAKRKRERKDFLKKKRDLGYLPCVLSIALPKFSLNTVQEIFIYPILFELLEIFMWILVAHIRIFYEIVDDGVLNNLNKSPFKFQ